MGPFWKTEGAFYIPDSGRKNEIIVTRIISTDSHPSSSPPALPPLPSPLPLPPLPPSSSSPSSPLVPPLLLVEVFAFFAEVGTWVEKDNLV